MIRILFVLFFLSFFSCSNEETTPDNVLPVPKMSAVLWDQMRMDEMVTITSREHKDSTLDVDAYRFGLYEEVFRVHGTNRTEFQKSMVYYQSRPDLMGLLLDSVQKKSQRQAPNRATRDSVL